MNKKLLGTIIFAAGAAIGSVATLFVVKKKYEQIAQEEIDSVKEEYNRLIKMRKKEISAVRNVINANKHDDNETEEAETDEDSGYEQMMIDYSNITKNYRSSEDNDDCDKENDEKGEEEVKDEVRLDNGPYVITPEEFGNETQYSAQPLDYFSDGVLADGWGVQLDIDDTIGEEALNHFGDYVDDVVHVRNDQNEIDYEVTRDPRTYDEARRINPNPYYGK